MPVHIVREEDELTLVAEAMLSSFQEAPHACVVALKGDLGAGKTALTKALARVLGIEETVTSPTFVIMKSYAIPAHPLFRTLVHIDAYRIESEEEMRIIGFQNICSDSHTIVCVEWPERITGLLPKDTHFVTIEITGMTRTITYGGT